MQDDTGGDTGCLLGANSMKISTLVVAAMALMSYYCFQCMLAAEEMMVDCLYQSREEYNTTEGV